MKKIISTLTRVVKEVYQVSPRYFWLIIVLSVFVGASPVISLWALKSVINTIAYSMSLQFKEIIQTLLLFGGVNLFVRVNQSLQNYYTQKLRIEVEYTTGLKVLNKCEQLGVSDFENGEKYNVIAKGENEGRLRIFSTYQNVLFTATQFVSLVSVILVILSWKSYVFLMVLIVPIITTFMNTYINYKYYDIRMKRMQAVRKTTYIQYLLTNDIASKEIKAYQVGGYLINMFSGILRKIQSQDKELYKKRSMIEISTSIIDEGISIVVLYQIIKMTIDGILKIGDTIAYFDSLSVVQSSISSILGLISSLSTDSLYVSQYYNLLDLPVDEKNINEIKVDKIEKIEFRKVSFRYETCTELILKDIDFVISLGEVIVIVGENGSGKSTLVKLICGFYSNYEGSIYINGIELSHVDKNSLRRAMGIVFQDFNKYELSLRENIGFGNLDLINEDNIIWNSLKKVDLDHRVFKFENGLDTQMGHWFSGEQFSKGQWQRVALARAFINNPSAYIFDEPTASLDPKIEREIYQLMKSFGESKICLFVTHRFDNIEDLNPRVIMISEGQIVSDAFHSDLFASSNVYRDLIGA